jgi:hypothetical protein
MLRGSFRRDTVDIEELRGAMDVRRVFAPNAAPGVAPPALSDIRFAFADTDCDPCSCMPDIMGTPKDIREDFIASPGPIDKRPADSERLFTAEGFNGPSVTLRLLIDVTCNSQ